MIQKIEDDDVDPVEKMIKQTGCLKLHYRVQECIASTQDWRKCQNEVKEFRMCIQEHNRRKNKSS